MIRAAKSKNTDDQKSGDQGDHVHGITFNRNKHAPGLNLAGSLTRLVGSLTQILETAPPPNPQEQKRSSGATWGCMMPSGS